MLRSTTVRTRGPLVLLVLLCVAVSGCGDAGGDPLAVLNEESKGALSIDGDLPSLPEIMVRSEDATGIEGQGSAGEWTARWEASWLMEAEAGREARADVYEEATDPLARNLEMEEIRKALSTVEVAADDAASAAPAEIPPLFRARIEETRELVAWGFDALDEGQSGEALRAALVAADRMRTVSPESVAKTLLTQARSRSEDLSAHPPEERERIDRLISGAQRALDDEDYRRAIYRAFYACQLQGLQLP